MARQNNDAWELGRNAKRIRLDSLLQYCEVLLDKYEENEEDSELNYNVVLDADGELLKEDIKFEIKEYFVTMLNLLECGLAENKPLFEELRCKILRGGNDAIRNLNKKIDNYHVLKMVDSVEVYRKDKNGEFKRWTS